MSKIVLIGDSIFDNAGYVGHGPSVIQQLVARLPPASTATLLAIDGSVTADVAAQARRIPVDATHLIISCGGNDALGQLGVLKENSTSLMASLARFVELRDSFDDQYARMLDDVFFFGGRIAVCTIYDAIPGMDRVTLCALAFYNDVIVRRAALAKIPVLELRAICTNAADYSSISPIEPSVVGGEKIAALIARFVATGAVF